MMDLKFRAWDNARDEYFQVRSLSFSTSIIDKNLGIVATAGDQSSYGPNMILEQCTGLKDANGKEIYEGDIIHFGIIWCVGDECDPREEEHIGAVEYRQDCASYVVNCNGKIFPLEELISFDGYSVQGNVHENPELLEAAK